jgi:hypothetical protein
VDEIGVKLNLRGKKTVKDFWIDPSLMILLTKIFQIKKPELSIMPVTRAI